MRNRRVLVIGRSGQLAHALAVRAASHGIAAVVRGRPELDLTNLGQVSRALAEVEPSVVINAAAYTAVDKAEQDRDAAFKINAAGPAILATLSAARGIPLIHVSTDYVFDGLKRTPYVEDDTIAPLSVYGASKAEGEFAVRQMQPQHVILRTSWVYGVHGPNFVKTMLRLAAERTDVGVVNDQHGAPTSAADLADVIFALASHMAAQPDSMGWGTYHAAASGETTWHGVAAEIFARTRAAGMKTPVLKAIGTADYPAPACRPANSRLDCRKLEAAFGLKLPPWEASLAACLDDLLSANRERVSA